MGRKRKSGTDWKTTRREVEGILARLEERIRLANEREERRRERLRCLTFGLIGRT